MNRTEHGRIETLARFYGALAQRCVVAVASDDPAREMAAVMLDDLQWRLDGMCLEIVDRQAAGLRIEDIAARIVRMEREVDGHTARRAAAMSLVLTPHESAKRRAEHLGGAVLDGIAGELGARVRSNLSTGDLLARLGRLARALLDTGSSNTSVVATLANSVHVAVQTHAGIAMRAGPSPRAPLAEVDHETYAALMVASQRHGIVAVALYMFAKSYPEHAARLDRASLERLVASVHTANASRWRAACAVARERLGIVVDPTTPKQELKKRRRKRFGPPALPGAH